MTDIIVGVLNCVYMYYSLRDCLNKCIYYFIVTGCVRLLSAIFQGDNMQKVIVLPTLWETIVQCLMYAKRHVLVKSLLRSWLTFCGGPPSGAMFSVSSGMCLHQTLESLWSHTIGTVKKIAFWTDNWSAEMICMLVSTKHALNSIAFANCHYYIRLTKIWNLTVQTS